MAAPASSKCEKCGADVPAGAALCPECGAPVGDPADAESAVYPELAKANLARMRGDYKQAEDVLLAVLRQYPNNPSANEMLGDLAAEREDWPHAMNWYELALEIVPDSASIARKLRDARDKIAQKQTQDTTAQLGLPDPSSRVPLLITVVILLLLGVAGGAYYLGTRGAGPAKPRPVINVQAQPDQPMANPNAQPEGQPTHEAVATVPEEEQLLQAVQAAAPDGGVISVSHDPRSSTLTVTFRLTGKDDRAAAAKLAGEAFGAATGYQNLVLRGVSDGKIAYMADVSRATYTETQAPEWKQQHTEAAALENYLLKNEWPQPAPLPETTGQTAGGPGAATTEGATGQ